MLYINENTLEYPVTEGAIKEQYPNTSWSETFVAPNPWVRVFDAPLPEYDAVTHNLVEQQPKKIDGCWWRQWSVVALPEEVASANRDLVMTARANAMRWERTLKLAESDWTQLADAPVDKTAWAEYRQALRDVTDQPGFPWSIEWPTKPE